MSYYSYKKKCYIDMNGMIFPLVKYADSSVRTWDGKWDYHWCHFNITDQQRLLIPKDEWEKAKEDRIEWDLDRLRSCSWIEKEPDMESYNYAGNTYPGGSRIKHLRNFLSTRKLIRFEDFLMENHGGFRIVVKYYDAKTFEDKKTQSYQIDSEEDLIKADLKFQKFAAEKPKFCGICVGICGIIL